MVIATYNGIVNTEVTIDKAGRLVLPKPVRDKLHLSAGDTLEVSVEGEQVVLRPRRTVPPLQKERGVWVFRTGEPMAAAEIRETLSQIRERLRYRPGDGD